MVGLVVLTYFADRKHCRFSTPQREVMTTADRVDQASSIPTSRKVLCVVYGAIAVAALVATWSQNLAYAEKPARFLLDFMNDSKVTPASRSLTVDILLFFLAATILMVI